MVEIGALTLTVALVVAAFGAVGSFAGVWRRVPELVESARYGLYTTPFLLLISTLALVYAFVTNDFSVRYVAENSNLAMPQVYTWVAFYAGNSGSMLYIALVFSVLVVLAVLSMRRKLPGTTPYAMGMMALVLTFFLAVMVFMANPLERLPMTPPDGRGINPLLIHFGMFIHPPVQMLALISVAVPFSIVIGALLAGKGGRDEWVGVGRTWGLISWLLLTFGLLLGSWWAYTILGWGGYWAWDPVENAALMPWLAMTAFVHSIMVQARRGMFRMWNVIIIIVTFTLASYGMFMNRGGSVPSVHSFAQSTMGWVFLGFMVVGLFGSLAALYWRRHTLKSREGLDSLVSRESAFLLNNVLFLTVAFVTVWGTTYPLITQLVQGTTITVGEPFYNRVNGPLILALVFLMGVGPLLPWRRATTRQLLLKLRYPFAVAVAVGIALPLAGVRQPVAVFAFAVLAMVVTSIFEEWFRGTRARYRRGENVFMAFGRLLNSNRPRYGGYIIHLAIIMLALGATASSFYGTQQDIRLSPGEWASIGEYRFQYTGVSTVPFSDRQELTARFEAYREDTYLGRMEPQSVFYRSFSITATQAAIRSTPIQDVYIIPSEFQEDGQAIFRFLINPMVWWMWASGPLLLLGTLVALWPQRVPAPVPARVPARVRTAQA